MYIYIYIRFASALTLITRGERTRARRKAGRKFAVGDIGVLEVENKVGLDNIIIEEERARWERDGGL